MKLFSVLVLALVALLSGCANPRQDELDLKESVLAQKEYELLLKEQLLDIRQERLEKAGVNAKFVSGTDTALVNRSITGLWLVDQTCIKTDCDSSVVGDRKSEQWEFFYKEDLLIAKAMAGNKLVRFYIGNYDDKIIELLYKRKEGTAQYPAAKISVTLRETGPARMEGQREIRRNGCITVYSVVLKKQ